MGSESLGGGQTEAQDGGLVGKNPTPVSKPGALKTERTSSPGLIPTSEGTRTRRSRKGCTKARVPRASGPKGGNQSKQGGVLQTGVFLKGRQTNAETDEPTDVSPGTAPSRGLFLFRLASRPTPFQPL